MTKTLSGLDNILSEEDKELVAKACMNGYNEANRKISELEDKREIYESFAIGFPFGIVGTGILVTSLSLSCYLMGDIQCATDIIKAYALIAPAYVPLSFIFYKLAKGAEDKISEKKSEAVLYKLCYDMFKEKTKQLKY